MKKVFSLLVFIAITNVCISDDMGDRTVSPAHGKYKMHDYVMVNLKGTKYNGKCDAIGRIRFHNYNISEYGIQGIVCDWGVLKAFYVKEFEIIDVFKDGDFQTGGRYGSNNILKKGLLFFRDKTKDYLPCMRNDFNDDKKEELCNSNKNMFY